MTIHHVGELAVAVALGVGRFLGTALLEAVGEGIFEVVKERFGRHRSPRLSDLEGEAERRRSAFWAETLARAERAVDSTCSVTPRVARRARASCTHRETAS